MMCDLVDEKCFCNTKNGMVGHGELGYMRQRFRADLQFLDELERWKIERMENPQPLPCTVLYCTVELDRKVLPFFML